VTSGSRGPAGATRFAPGSSDHPNIARETEIVCVGRPHSLLIRSEFALEFAGAGAGHAAGPGALNAKAKKAARPRNTNATK
jgi:hypothetical protein